MFIYLGGCLTYYSKTNQWDKATYWREQIIDFLEGVDFKYFNPVKTFENPQNHTYNHKSCVEQNRHYLKKSNILVVCLDDILQSPGTQWEMFYASEILNIPVITFGEVSWSPHIRNGISTHCKNIQEVIEVITNMFEFDF